MKTSSLQSGAKVQFATDGTRIRLSPRRPIIISGGPGLAFTVLYVDGLMLLCRLEGDPGCRQSR